MISPTQLEVETCVKHLTRVDDRLAYTNFWKRIYLYQEVLGVLAIPVERECQAVVQETCIKTQVHLLRSLPSQIWICQTCWLRTIRQLTVTNRWIVLIEALVDSNRRSILVTAQYIDVTILTPRSTKLQEGNSITTDVVLEELLIADSPTSRYGWEVTPTSIL